MHVMKNKALTRWTSEDSAELYNVRNWGAGYFDISEKGHAIVKPYGEGTDVSIDLMDLVEDIRKKDTSMPVLIRFADILACQIRLINESFRKAIKDANYNGAYRPVYPIKVNQKQRVVQDIMEFGRKYHHGLEAGSKAELIAAISNIGDTDSYLVCNGYKDEEFIDLALMALKMGIQTFIVIEMPSELSLVLERAKLLKVEPRLGVRAKLSARAGGHWDSSGGDRSKFGLDSSQIIDLVDDLRKAGKLGCLELLHYHVGSQVSDIKRVRQALQEACRVYVELVREGAKMGILNIGGGLAVDYDGSRTNFNSSCNYSVQEYAADVVEVIMKAANDANVPHPTIVSESGRATITHHSILIFNVLDVRRFEPHTLPPLTEVKIENETLRNLIDVKDMLSQRNFQEAYHDALYYRDEIRSSFHMGKVSLRERALAEDIFWHIVRRIANMIPNQSYVPDEMEGLEPAIADVYYGNFSLFQSLPDAWAVDQLFPVMPIHRLAEMPTRQAVIADITCDSDGKIDTFIDLHDVKKILPLHELDDDKEYLIGVYLVGAYQETLGDMHNLLGEVNVIHVRVNKQGKIEYVREVPGDSVENVLKYVEYNPKKVIRHITRTAERALQNKAITAEEKKKFIQTFSVGMKGYTYFEI